MRKIRHAIFDHKGATAIEYGLIAALVALAAIGGMTTLGNSLNSSFDRISTSLSSHV